MVTKKAEILSVEGVKSNSSYTTRKMKKIYPRCIMAGPLGCRLFSCKMECYDFSYAQIHSKSFALDFFCLSKFSLFEKHDLPAKTRDAKRGLHGRQDGSQQSLHFFRWNALEAMNSDGKQDIVAAAAKKQETFFLTLARSKRFFESRL